MQNPQAAVFRCARSSRPTFHGDKARAAVIGLLCFALSAAPLFGGDLFEVTVQSAGARVIGSDSSVISLLDRAINADGEFAVFAGTLRNASLSYAGVRDAMRFTMDAAETSAVLEIPITGFRRTFTGADADDIQGQIEDFLKEDGLKELAKFYKEINARSVVAVTDGNPHSSTALLANRAFDLFGTYLGQTREEKTSPKEPRGGANFGVVPDVGAVNAGGYQGTSLSLPLDLRAVMGKRVGLAFDVTPNYLEIEGSQVFQLGLGLGVPVKIIKPGADQPWLWQVTPSAGAIVAGSADYAAGGLLFDGTITSLVGYEFKHFAISMGNQFGFFDTIELAVGDYEFDSGVEQQILKNGLQVSVPFGQRWVGQVQGTHTFFLEDAAVPDYFTVGGSVAYRWLGRADAEEAKRGYVFLGVYADLGDDYTAPHVRLGTAWKF